MPGILHPGEAPFHFAAPEAAPALRPYVVHYWIVTWDLRGRPPHEQHVLPYPGVNMTFKPGRCRVAGVPLGRFREVLEGAGRVFGVRFRPGGFHPILGRPVAEITDRFLPVEDVLGAAGADLATAILSADDARAVTIMDAFLADRLPATPHPDAVLAAAVVDRTAADPGLTRVDDLAAAFEISPRRLQRLFADYVGVPPKWVIRRHRLHEATERIAAPDAADLARLAADLGYSDQAHLTRDFTAMIGQPPARYARAQDR